MYELQAISYLGLKLLTIIIYKNNLLIAVKNGKKVKNLIVTNAFKDALNVLMIYASFEILKNIL